MAKNIYKVQSKFLLCERIDQMVLDFFNPQLCQILSARIFWPKPFGHMYCKTGQKYFQLARCTLNIFRIFYISKVLFAHTYNIGRGNEKIHYYLEKNIIVLIGK